MMREVQTYERLERLIRSWVEGYVRMMLVVGPPGLGKTSTYQEVIAEVQQENAKQAYTSDAPAWPLYHRLTGRMSAIECFRLLRDEPRSLVIFDDLVGVLGDPHFISLLQQLCETRPFRLISWKTNAQVLHDESKEFMCVAQVLIVLNQVPRKNDALKAILDRMDPIRFKPSNAEILAKMRQLWPEEGELIDLMEETAVTPTLRTMCKALEWQKSPHLDVVEELVSECGVPMPIQHLCNVMRDKPEAVWFEHYHRATGRSERSFRRHKRIAEDLIAARCGGQPLGLGNPARDEQSPAEGSDIGGTDRAPEPPPDGGDGPPVDGLGTTDEAA